jgi:hypothetical protein
MILKIVTLFLVVMVILGLFGKLRTPRIGGPRDQRQLGRPRKCAKCGRFLIGKSPCNCERGG